MFEKSEVGFLNNWYILGIVAYLILILGLYYFRNKGNKMIPIINIYEENKSVSKWTIVALLFSMSVIFIRNTWLNNGGGFDYIELLLLTAAFFAVLASFIKYRRARAVAEHDLLPENN